jgi:hypothetical protein
MHLTDSFLTLSSPAGNLIYLSQSDKDVAKRNLYIGLIISRFIRNTIDLIMGISFLILVKRVSDIIYTNEQAGRPKEIHPSDIEDQQTGQSENLLHESEIDSNVSEKIVPVPPTNTSF